MTAKIVPSPEGYQTAQRRSPQVSTMNGRSPSGAFKDGAGLTTPTNRDQNRVEAPGVKKTYPHSKKTSGAYVR